MATVYLAEVKITARLDHPRILTLIDSGATGGLSGRCVDVSGGKTVV